MAVYTNQTDRLRTATSAPGADFIYSPPAAAQGATRILVKPNLGYPKGPPITVGMSVLSRVLQGLRQASPQAEILVVEGVCSKQSLAEIAGKNGLYDILDGGMTLLDADTLPCVAYPNRSPQPVRYTEMWAPQLLQEVDCRISVSAFKVTSLKQQPLISATLKNLYGLFPRAKYKARSPNSRGQLHRPSVPQILQDVYFSIGHLFDGGVADCSQKFISKDWRPDVGTGVEVGHV
ncbi:MAG: DUF362 domain-containing protein, partial [Cyanobacteria bacterium P01_D01_bin.2]